MEYGLGLHIKGIDDDTLKAFREIREAAIELDTYNPDAPNPLLGKVVQALAEDPELAKALVAPSSELNSKVIGMGANACSAFGDTTPNFF